MSMNFEATTEGSAGNIKPVVLSATFERLMPDDFPNREQVIRDANEILAKGELQRRVESIVSPDVSQKRFNLNDLLELQRDLASPAESLAAAQLFENVIESRWAAGAHEMECDVDVERLREVFADAREVEYEFMPTKVDRDITPGGLGKLIIGFPQGAKEQDLSHTHPGGRIVIAVMQDGEFHSPEEGRGRKMQHGTAILMPAGAPHNFASIGERTGETSEDISVDDILDKKVPGTVFLSFHIGYTDVESDEALQYVQ